MMLRASTNGPFEIPRFGNIDQQYFSKNSNFFMTVRNWSVCQSKSASSRQQLVCLWLLHDPGLLSTPVALIRKFQIFKSKILKSENDIFLGTYRVIFFTGTPLKS